jgi:hypothetical protein
MMKFDMEHYKRLPDGHADKSYEWLIARIQDRLNDERTLLVESQLGRGAPPPPALAAPSGTVCFYFTKGSCRKEGACDMIHDTAAQKAYRAANGPAGGGGGKGGAAGGGGGKVGGKGDQQKKGEPKGKGKGTGKLVGALGGNPNSKFPCYAFHRNNCHSPTCNHCHRPLTEEEIPVMLKWEAKSASRASSPGAPATGICPEYLKGTCILGALCNMEHPDETKPKGRKGRAKAEAK